MATTPLDINGARSWIDQQIGGSYGANGQFQPGSMFNNGVFDASNTQRDQMVLGKAQQMGYTPDQISQILGIPASQISAFQSNPQNAPGINTFASSFQTDASNPASYMTQSGVTNDQIQGWLASHPGATDSQIAQTMQQYGVTPGQMAGATDLPTQQVTDRYSAAINGANGPQHGPQPHNGGMAGGMGGSGGVMGMNGGQSGGVAGYGASGNSGNFGNFSQNPYLSSMADEIGRRTQLGLTDAFNQIRGDGVATNGLGGSRQGVAQGVATRGAMDSLQGNLAGLFGGQYNQDANRGLQQYGMDQNFYTAQRGQDLAQIGLGANIYSMGQQNGWNGLNSASNIYNNAAGQTTSGSGSQQQGGGAMGAFGGALGGAQLANNLVGPSGYNGSWGINW
jgi:hypothetical protein